MKTIKDLKDKTNKFFELHWPNHNNYPKWSDVWKFLGPIPYNENQGCYALLKNNEIVYIGVGLSKGYGIYTGAGLGNRLHKYWRKKRNNLLSEKAEYEPSKEYENKIDGIITIGFPKYNYLAAALELYLISELKPPMNKIGKS